MNEEENEEQQDEAKAEQISPKEEETPVERKGTISRYLTKKMGSESFINDPLNESNTQEIRPTHISHNDAFKGGISKWSAHENTYLSNSDSLPHRAFSLFIFNHNN